MTPEEIQRKDLRNVCYHEHAHGQVAWHYGIPSIVEVEPNETPNPLEEKTWGGRCWYYSSLGLGERRRMIGLAGELAVLLLEEPDLHPQDAFDHLDLDPHALSETDRAFAGPLTYEDVEACMGLVRQLWPKIERAAEYEILKALTLTGEE